MFKLDDLELDFDVDDDVLNEALNVNNTTANSSFSHKNTESILRNKPQKNIVEASHVKITNEKNVCNKVLPQRKFPGPAGILPDIPLKDLNKSIPLNQSNVEDLEIIKNESVIFSQTSASVFEEPPYIKLLSDFNMKNSNSPLNKFTIDWVKKKAVHGTKIPFLALVLHQIDFSMPDPKMILRDPTGEIVGTLHRDVLNDMQGKLHPGAALAVRQVGVIGVSRRQVCLLITNTNILSVYSAADDDTQEVETINIHPMSSIDLIKSIDDWQAQVQAQSSNTPKNNSTINSLFSHVNQDSPSNLKRKLNQSTPIKKPNNNSNKPATSCHFDISFDDINFDDFTEDTSADQNKNSTGIQFQPKFDIEVRCNKPVLKKTESDLVPTFKPKDKIICSQVLTQKESQMVEEVLDGIDLDDFEM